LYSAVGKLNQNASIYRNRCVKYRPFKHVLQFLYSSTAKVNNYQKWNSSSNGVNLFHVSCQYKGKEIPKITLILFLELTFHQTSHRTSVLIGFNSLKNRDATNKKLSLTHLLSTGNRRKLPRLIHVNGWAVGIRRRIDSLNRKYLCLSSVHIIVSSKVSV
jgi:hypothetical protein